MVFHHYHERIHSLLFLHPFFLLMHPKYQKRFHNLEDMLKYNHLEIQSYLLNENLNLSLFYFYLLLMLHNDNYCHISVLINYILFQHKQYNLFHQMTVYLHLRNKTYLQYKDKSGFWNLHYNKLHPNHLCLCFFHNYEVHLLLILDFLHESIFTLHLLVELTVLYVLLLQLVFSYNVTLLF